MLIEYMDRLEKDHYRRIEKLLEAGSNRDDELLTEKDKLLNTVKKRVIYNLTIEGARTELILAQEREVRLQVFEQEQQTKTEQI